MCIIFYNERGVKYQERELRNAFRTNDDGVGLMWVEDGKVQTFHGMLTEEKLVKMMRDFEGVPHALHLRFATNGPPCKELCHPFKATPAEADQSVWLMHNGVLFEHGHRAQDNESDTLVFARDCASDVSMIGGSTDIFFDDAYIEYMEKVISGDRMIFLRDDGSVSILNPTAWYHDKDTGIWYSNRYSVADRPRYTSYGWSGMGFRNSYPLTSTSKASAMVGTTEGVTSDAKDEAESKASYPGGGSYATPAKSAEESAKILLAENPVTEPTEAEIPAVSDDEDADDEDEVLYFKWEGDEFVPCELAEADIEVDADEYYEHWTDDDEDDDEIEWD